ncbi:hypothetical protein KQI65_14640 [bacterium]|nr:hypothetical protein [bacterium]
MHTLLMYASIDIHIEYARNESTAYLYEHDGISIEITGGALVFTYEVQHNAVQTRTRSIGPISLPQGISGAFDLLQCGYDAASGEGWVSINGVRQGTNWGNKNRDLAWSATPGDVTIGRLLDGGGGSFVTLGSVAVYTGHVGVTPVELTHFSAYRKDAGITLQWRTATELNNHGFEIQRRFPVSRGDSDWEVLGFVPGGGTVQTPSSYVYEDRNIPASATRVSYRLQAGAYTYILNREGLPAGMYMLIAHTSSGSAARRLIVQ